MLSRDVLVLHLFGLLLRRCEYLCKTRTEILLTTLDTRKAPDGRLTIVEDNLYVRTQLAK